jgi:hypothetical protein
MKTKRITMLLSAIAGLLAVSLAFTIPANQLKQDEIRIANLVKDDVCPPFFLLTQNGDTINPVLGINIDEPYSPKQTCGKCHDYELITSGYHFQQGKDEAADSLQASRSKWVSHAGNYGGNWCSPAPLYSYLSPKQNSSEKLMDMTSFDFVNKCGVCHPGGGSLEYDRNNRRYDEGMTDSNFGYKDGANNQLDGDYYKAYWKASGVIEADCFICHLPGYNNKERVRQIQQYNYQYAALAASGLGKVDGAVKSGEAITITYDNSKFNADGRLEPHIVKEPRNEACLWCHAKPGYKKRGADYTQRNDVHLAAGLKCVDCHPAGSAATDERINGYEMHQIAKGDDPGGVVRNDLDNTMRSCTDCHESGYLGAPYAAHSWLPQLHLEKIACQTCHIPDRYVKSAHYVASDVFNPGTKIPSKGKHLWTFYGPDMQYWNHYGDLEMMGYDDKPTFSFKPELIRYQGKIYPANRVHTSWPGLLTATDEALMQPKMSDVYKMWNSFKTNPESYPELAVIADDNEDGVIEINRPEEIDGLITAVTSMLNKTNYPLGDQKVVWVMNNRIYTSGRNYFELEMQAWEASPYGNVHTYNHDIQAANAALGAKSCTECHATNADFFYASVLQYPVNNSGIAETQPQYKVMGMNGFMVWLSAIREQYLKNIAFALLLILFVVIVLAVLFDINHRKAIINLKTFYLMLAYLASLAALLLIWIKPDLHAYILPERIVLDKNHFLISMIPFIAGFYVFFDLQQQLLKSSLRYKLLAVFLTLAAVSGLLIMIKFSAISGLVAFSFTLFELCIIVISLLVIIHFIGLPFQKMKRQGLATT